MKHIIGAFALCLTLLSVPAWSQGPIEQRMTNLPTVHIHILDGTEVTSKTTYKWASMEIVDDDGEVSFDSVQIRGRGNSTWNMKKKPYRLKFPKKQRLLGPERANAKSWTLLANAGDKTMMRNALASDLGELLGLTFNPGARFVDLTMNGTYRGTYQISDQVNVNRLRVNITEQKYRVTNPQANVSGGYLMEVGTDGGEVFRTSRGVRIRVYDPEDSIGTLQRNYIRNYVQTFEDALFGKDFADVKKGWKQYVDTVSLVNLYLANEIAANADGFYSTYFYKEKDDPLFYWGPLWDFDIAFNNCGRLGDVTESLMIDRGFGDDLMKRWLHQMWKTPWFARYVIRRYEEVYNDGLDAKMLAHIDYYEDLLRESAQKNYQVWGISTRAYEEIVLFSTYKEYVDYVREFVPKHNAWLLQKFRSMEPQEPTKPFEVDTNYVYKFYNKGVPTSIIGVNGENAAVGLYASVSENEEQQWEIIPFRDYLLLKNRRTGLMLTDTESKTQLEQRYFVATSKRQLWEMVPQSNGYYNLKNVASGRIVNNSNGRSTDGNPILVLDSSDRDATSENRLWRIVKDGDKWKPVDVGIHSAEAEVDYALTYNRNTQRVRFLAADVSELTFQADIHDLHGRLVARFAAREGYDASVLPAGTYVVNWYFAGRRHSGKFIKH